MILQHSFKSVLNSTLTLMLGLTILTTTGCLGGLGLNNAAVLPTEPTADSAGQYQVEMTGNFSKSSVFKGEIDGPLTVQDALERSGATKKFRSMDVMIYRVVKESGFPLKMPVEYKARNKTVLPEMDYALHPNDRIAVRARSTNAIDKVIDSLNPNN